MSSASGLLSRLRKLRRRSVPAPSSVFFDSNDHVTSSRTETSGEGPCSLGHLQLAQADTPPSATHTSSSQAPPIPSSTSSRDSSPTERDVSTASGVEFDYNIFCRLHERRSSLPSPSPALSSRAGHDLPPPKDPPPQPAPGVGPVRSSDPRHSSAIDRKASLEKLESVLGIALPLALPLRRVTLSDGLESISEDPDPAATGLSAAQRPVNDAHDHVGMADRESPPAREAYRRHALPSHDHLGRSASHPPHVSVRRPRLLHVQGKPRRVSWQDSYQGMPPDPPPTPTKEIARPMTTRRDREDVDAYPRSSRAPSYLTSNPSPLLMPSISRRDFADSGEDVDPITIAVVPLLSPTTSTICDVSEYELSGDHPFSSAHGHAVVLQDDPFSLFPRFQPAGRRPSVAVVPRNDSTDSFADPEPMVQQTSRTEDL